MMPAPTALGLFVCDQATRDLQTGNISLIGSIKSFVVPHFPGYPDPFSVFSALKGGQGTGRAALEIRDLNSDSRVYRALAFITFPDRLDEVNFHMRVTKCRFVAPGTYELYLWIDQDLVAQRVIRVYQKENSS
jgi:hypothetical protein